MRICVTRFIPAPAGNTNTRMQPGRRRSVHPRACGGHQIAPPIFAVCGGSSPRLRGTRRPARFHGRRRRFIPAPAGNTPSVAPRSVPGTVHPRACGEHAIFEDDATADGGSSPRLRGTRVANDAEDEDGRFIPAPAGNTHEAVTLEGKESVHPRACGEHRPGRPGAPDRDGSSPRLRGTLAPAATRISSGRFIPAPAGNTRNGAAVLSYPPVHPRACGEHSVPSGEEGSTTGSSPRLRGTRRGPGGVRRRRRFIPAPAGNTPQQTCSPAKSSVHPRACGEHDALRSQGRNIDGSSPRLRGTR